MYGLVIYKVLYFVLIVSVGHQVYYQVTRFTGLKSQVYNPSYFGILDRKILI